MNDAETLAALERAAKWLDTGSIMMWHEADTTPEADAALIRAHIETLRNGGERAQIVAWLRVQPNLAQISPDHFRSNTPAMLADAIAAGARLSPRVDEGE